MKKILTAFILVMALCVTSIPAFAAEADTGDTTIYHKIGQIVNINDPDNPTDDEIAGTYTVSIPAYIEAAPKDQTPADEQDVCASDVLIPYGTQLLVKMEFDGKLRLKSNNDVTVGYKMQIDGYDATSGSSVLSVPAGNPDEVTSAVIGSVLTETPVYAGIYANTATFVFSVS